MFRLVYRNLPLSNFIFRFHPRQHSFALVWSLFYLYSGISVSKISYNPFPWLYRTRATNPSLNLNWKMSNIERDQSKRQNFFYHSNSNYFIMPYPAKSNYQYNAGNHCPQIKRQKLQSCWSNPRAQSLDQIWKKAVIHQTFLRIQSLNQYFNAATQSINQWISPFTPISPFNMSNNQSIDQSE